MIKKKIFLFTFILIISLCLSGCGSSPVVMTEPLHSIKVDDNSFIVSYPTEREKYFHAIATPRGILWNPVPSMEGHDLDAYPTSPFVLYLSSKDTTKLEVKDKGIITLPLYMDSPIGKLDVFLGELFNNGNDWVIYDTYLKKVGMNQPYLSKLYAINLNDNRNIFITDFHTSGGNLFSFGMHGDTVLFDQQIPNAQSNLSHNVIIFNLLTGQRNEISTNDIERNNAMEYFYKGNTYAMNPL